jgi:Holliday junction resolvase RusA-like endonuclease
MPLLEFTVLGPPVSHQTKDRANLRAWKDKVLAAASKPWRSSPVLTKKLHCTIMNFHEGHVASLDDDNMVKPIRDALNGHVYRDDSQISHSETVHFCIDAPLRIRGASSILLAAFCAGEEFVYFRLDSAPEVIQLPR